jgi:hypothetical protein
MKPLEGVVMVRRTSDGQVAELLAVEGENIRVRVDGEEKVWSRSSVRPMRQTIAPRGVAKPTARMLEAARLAALPREAGGLTRAELAAKYGVTVHAISSWMVTVRHALEDAASLAATR